MCSALVGVRGLQRERPPTRWHGTGGGVLVPVLDEVRAPPGGVRRGALPAANPSNERPSVNEGALTPVIASNVGARSTFPVSCVTCVPAVTGAADQQGHVDVGVVRRLLPRRQTVLAEVEAIVRCEHDVRVVELPAAAQRVHQTSPHHDPRLGATGFVDGRGRRSRALVATEPREGRARKRGIASTSAWLYVCRRGHARAGTAWRRGAWALRVGASYTARYAKNGMFVCTAVRTKRCVRRT